MKKYLIVPASALTALLMTTAAFAQTSVVPSVDENNRVTVSVRSDSAAEEIYTVMIMKADEKADSNTGAGTVSNVYKFETIKGMGKAELKFSMRASDKRGLYQVVTGGGELSGDVTYFAVPEDSERSAALAKLNAASESAVYGVLSEHNNRVWVIDFSDPRYTSDSGNVIKSFAAMSGGKLKSGADAEKCFRNACALSEIRKASETELLSLLTYHAEELGMNYSEAVKSGNEKIMKAFTYLAADTEKNPIHSAAQLDTVLKRAEALGFVNSATRQNLQSIIEKYADVLEVSTAGDYASIDKYELVKLLIKENQSDYKSVKEFSDAFAAAVKTVADNESKPADITGGGGGGKGSGSSGGGGGGKSVGITPSMNVTDPGTAVGTKESESGSRYFSDLSGSSWAVKYIDYAAYKGIMSGDGDGTFRPEDKISREEFLKIVIEALGIGKDEVMPPVELKYSDVGEDDWFFGYVKKGNYFGIITGIAEDSFGTGQTVTRQDAAVILMRAKEKAKLVLRDTAEQTDFSDGADIADYAKDAIVKLQKAGIINGYENGEFRPNGGVTRAEAAKIIYGILSNTDLL